MRKQSKKDINLANISNGKPQAGDVLISPFLPSSGGQGSEQRCFSLAGAGFSEANFSVFCITRTKAMKSKSKKQFHRGVRFGSLSFDTVSHLFKTQTINYTKERDHEGPCSFATAVLAPARPLTHHGGLAPLSPSMSGHPLPPALPGPGSLSPHWILIILSYLWKRLSLPIFDPGVSMWLAFDQRDAWENLLGDF